MEMKNDSWALNTKRNTKLLAYWTFAWLLTMAVVAFGPKLLWNFNPTISILAILVNTIVGIGMILANIKHINGLDEMQRKVSMESMAIALGVAVVGGLSYSMLDVANVISFDAEISHLVILIGLTYLAGTVIGNLRYK